MKFTAWIRKHQLISFFALSYLITYVADFLYIWLYPGQPLNSWSFLWFIEVFGPSFSALILTAVIGRWPAVKHLLSGFTRFKVGFWWYFAAFFLFLGPLVITLTYQALGGSYPGLQTGQTTASLAGIVVFTFFSGPFAEELGWRGFALPRLQARYNALVSSLILGVIWTFWHLPLYFIAGSSQMGIPIPLYLLLVTTVCVYITWLFNNTRGSLVLTVLAHFFFNMTGFLNGPLGMIPAMFFNMTAGPLLALVTIAIVIIFKPRYLSKKPVEEMPFRKVGAGS